MEMIEGELHGRTDTGWYVQADKPEYLSERLEPLRGHKVRVFSYRDLYGQRGLMLITCDEQSDR